MRDHDRSLPLLLALLALPLAGCPTPSEDDDESLFGDLDAIVSEERPTKRSEVIAVAHEAGGEILMFGGNDAPIVDQIPRAAYRDDTWIFQAGVGWSELSVDGPHARGRYGATYDADGGRALLFGGRFREDGGSGNYDLFDDLWAFDFESGTWDELDADGGPSARYYPQLAWYDGALYVYGGLTNADPLAFQRSDELWKWTDGDGWEEISTSGDAPSPRAFYGTALDSARGHLVLFAGQVGDFQSLAFNDLYSLDLESGAWQELDNGGNGAPFTRMHPHIQYDGTRDRILLFGGHTDIGDDNDLWEFPAGGGEWDRIAEGDAFTGEGFGCYGCHSFPE